MVWVTVFSLGCIRAGSDPGDTSERCEPGRVLSRIRRRFPGDGRRLRRQPSILVQIRAALRTGAITGNPKKPGLRGGLLAGARSG